MPQGTITLPSGDKLITQTETLPSGALVHREEVVVSGTIIGRLALPTNSQPPITTYGLPVWEINDPKRIEITNYGHSGTPLRVDPTGTTTQPVSLVSLPSVTFSGAQPISSIAGTVQVAFTPSAVQSVNLLNVGFAGTPLVSSLSGSISIADYSRYSEQLTQSSRLSTIDADTIAVKDAIIGTPAVKFASAQPITFSGQQPIHGTVVVLSLPNVTVNSLPPVTFASSQPVSTVAGTVSVTFPSTQSVSVSGTVSAPDYARYSEQQAQTTSLQLVDDVVHVINAALGKIAAIGAQRNDSSPTLATEGAVAPPRITSQRGLHISLRNESGQELGTAGTPLRFDPTGATTQPVSISSAVPISSVAGTVQVAFTPAAVQSVNLLNVGFAGTPIVASLAGTPSVNIAEMPPISLAPITFASPQPISTVAGTVQVAFTPVATQNVNLMNVGFSGTPLRIDPTGTTTQPVSLVGSISLADYARYSEQLTQSSRLTTIDNDILANTVATLGTPAFKFASPQAVTFSGQQPIHGTVVASSLPPITFASPQSISSVSGTVSVIFPSEQAVSLSGTISLPDYARYSEQQAQSVSLQLLDDTVYSSGASFNRAIAIAGIVDDISTTAIGEGLVGPLRMTRQRAQHVSLRNEIGQEIGSAGTPLRFDPTGTTTQPVSNTVLSVVGGGAEATAQRVTIANDSTGVLSIDDNGGNISIDDGGNSITVDGQVNILLQNYGHSGTPLRIDPTGTTVQPISWSGVPTVSLPGTITANVRNSIFGKHTAKIDIGATGSSTIVSSVTGKRIKVTSINLQADRGGTISQVWLDGTVSLSGTQTYQDREGFVMSTQPPDFLLAPQAGTALVLHIPATSAAFPFNGGLRGWVSYFDDDSI